MQLLMFYLIGFFAVLSAVSMIVVRKPLNSALFLILNMICLAGLFALLNAHLIAVLQIIVYAGAIMVLVLFVIMVLNLREKDGDITVRKVAAQFVGIIVVSVVMVMVGASVDPSAISALGSASPEFGTVVGVGKTLFTDYILPFEIVSVLLLAAIIGAVILSKSKV